MFPSRLLFTSFSICQYLLAFIYYNICKININIIHVPFFRNNISHLFKQKVETIAFERISHLIFALTARDSFATVCCTVCRQLQQGCVEKLACSPLPPVCVKKQHSVFMPQILPYFPEFPPFRYSYENLIKFPSNRLKFILWFTTPLSLLLNEKELHKILSSLIGMPINKLETSLLVSTEKSMYLSVFILPSFLFPHIFRF